MQKDYEKQIQEVREELAQKVETQKNALDLLTDQLNAFLTNISMSYATLQVEQSSITKKLDNF